MNIKVAAFTVSEKSINITVHKGTQYVLFRTGGLIGLNMGSLSQICFYFTISLIQLLLK